METRFFQFEADFVNSLRCIPMQVRLKLDTCGIKLKLPQWHRFSAEERQTLVDLPCETETEVRAYQQLLQRLISERTGERATELAIDPHPAWRNAETVADSVQDKATEIGVTITPAQWANLSPEQRFALIKLSRSNHENANFLPALHEFQII
ncbi:nitrate reductase associated protein [Oculatella sp. FACHB-28]|uniref:nitrate reductase associated protein n=1 Tax=Oculatella sp. FACHB-28 TaxID=2692845 RepID=UPI001682D653|nr:nitrate reductase associated protein [Oculatella sp. FACHB-28]MBD2059371.1 nitrate reductase associated protein [Oculatella sp. FACHB-28]